MHGLHAGKHPTGINCESTKCGRPANWPKGRPFFLPLDLQDPNVWLRIGAAQPTLSKVSPQERIHLQVSFLHPQLRAGLCSLNNETVISSLHTKFFSFCRSVSPPLARLFPVFNIIRLYVHKYMCIQRMLSVAYLGQRRCKSAPTWCAVSTWGSTRFHSTGVSCMWC